MTDRTDLLAHLARQPARTALFCDFDGTLVPIVDDPSTSCLPSGLPQVLADLARSLAVVAVVSGRPASFLGERADVPGVRRLGLYGLEEWRDGESVSRPEAARWQTRVEDTRDDLRDLFGPEEGVEIEDKGLSVAVHWRNAPDRAAAERAVTTAMKRLEGSSGLEREPGKLVEELRPPVDWDKGAAVRVVVEEVQAIAVAYLGDDLGDLPAFAAVKDLGGWAVAVDHGEETPRPVREAADVLLDGPEGVTAFLTDLRDRLAPRG